MPPSTLERLSQLDRLLDEALDLRPAEQQDWLARIRVAEPALAADLEKMIASEPALDACGFLQHAAAADAPITSLVGRRIGAYTLERLLGRGGMGTVWLARRSDGRFEGRAAIKLLNLPMLDTAGAERFRREATALARLAHPNIARLVDAGVADDGQPYLVLEHVDGIPLDRYADQKRLSATDRIALLLQVLDAVSHAHANLIVHRDIKPSNLLVTEDGTVKLLDFGIAKLLVADGAEGERSLLTDAAGSALTPEYAAPEQVTGAPVTVATDVYALGVLMYLVLAGRHPTGEGAATPVEHLQRVVDVTPARVSAMASRSPELRRLYRGEFDTIVAKALKKAPAERYGTVNAFADDIRRFLRHEPVHARPDTVGYRTRKFVRRNRASVAAGIAVTFLLMATTGYALLQLALAQRDRDEARTQRDQAVLARQQSAASDNFMQAVFSTIGTSDRISAAELLNRARALLEQQYGDEPRFVARLMIQLASEFHLMLSVETERDLLERGLRYAARSGDPALQATAECRLGLWLARTTSDTAASQAHQVAARVLLRRMARPGPEALGSCLLAEAHLRTLQRQQAAAALLLMRFDSVAAGHTDSLSLGLAQDRFDAAETWYRLGRVRTGLAELQHCTRVLLQLGHTSSMLRLAVLQLQSASLSRLGELRAADSVNSLWLDLAQRHGADLTIFIELQTASHARWAGQPDSALRIWRRRVERARRNHTFGEAALFPLVTALVDGGHLGEARERAAEYGRLPDASPQQLLLARGRIAEAEGKSAEAREFYGDLLSSLGFPRSRDRLDMYWYYVIREGRMAFAQGDIAAADSLARQALTLARENEQDDQHSAEIGRIRLLQARVALARHDSTSARRLASLAVGPLEYGLGPDRRETLEARDFAAQLGGRRSPAVAVVGSRAQGVNVR